MSAATKSRPDTIPVIVDLPTSEPELGFESYVSAVSAAVRGGQPAQYTVGLYGPWGSGKSSILEALRRDLDPRENIVTVSIEAWRHQRVENLLSLLLWSVREALGRALVPNEKRDSAVSRLSRLINGLELQAFGFGIRIPTAEERTGANAGDDRVGDAVATYMAMFDELKGVTLDTSIERFVVLIDDLDRCSPDRVVEVVEAVRLFMDVTGFVFVLAVDYDVIIRSLVQKYPHIDADRFVEKIVQVPFRIPSLDSKGDTFISRLVPDWNKIRDVWFEDVTDEDIRSIIQLALRDNPRQVKRMLNSYMVARHVSWDEDANGGELFSALALQLGWPKEFDRLEADLRLMPDANPPKTLGEVESYRKWSNPSEGTVDAGLAQFLKKHLKAESGTADVFRAMRLAAQFNPITPTVFDAGAVIEEGAASVLSGQTKSEELVRKILGLTSSTVPGSSQVNFVDEGRTIVSFLGHSSGDVAFDVEITYPGKYDVPGKAVRPNFEQSTKARNIWTYRFHASNTLQDESIKILHLALSDLQQQRQNSK